MLVLPIAENFNELLQDGSVAAIAFLREFGRVMIMAIYEPLVLVVAVLGAEDGGTYRARKVFNMIFTLERCNV